MFTVCWQALSSSLSQRGRSMESPGKGERERETVREREREGGGETVGEGEGETVGEGEGETVGEGEGERET